MNDDNESNQSVRLRVSLPPVLNERVAKLAEAMGITHAQAITFALSLGVRALSLVVVNPVDASMQSVMDKRIEAEVKAAVREGGVKVRK
jgi:hypothetical protein